MQFRTYQRRDARKAKRREEEPGPRADRSKRLGWAAGLGNAGVQRLLRSTDAQRSGAGPKALGMQNTRGNQAVQRMLRQPAPGLERPVIGKTGEEKDLMRVSGQRAALQREDAGAAPALAAPTFPTMTTQAANTNVETARAADWTAGLTDYKERAGWIMWDKAAKTFSVTGKATGTEDTVNPGATPADSGNSYCVGHYHQHPPIRPGRAGTFPVGPSGADTTFANGRGNPGIVRDYTATARKTVTNYPYGPARRT